MAQYFTPPRHQSSSRDQATVHTANETFKLKLAALDESAVYVFPNPTSSSISIPTSPSQASDFSIPTELSLSAIETDSSSNAGHGRPAHLAQLQLSTAEWDSQLVFPEPSDGGLSTPTSSFAEGSSRLFSPLGDDFARRDQETGASTGAIDADNWRVRLTRYQETFVPHFIRDILSPRHTLDVNLGIEEPSPTSASQIRSTDGDSLPFLPLFLSLFSIDESTAELLRTDLDTTKSTLFGGQSPYDYGDDDEKAALVREDSRDQVTPGELHGLARLFVEEKFNAQYTVRSAFWDFARSMKDGART